MKYPPEEVARMGAQGFAFKMPDGEWAFPIANEEDLKNAIVDVTTAGIEYDPVRVFIMKRANDLGLIHTIPITWEPNGALRPTGGTTDGRSAIVRDSLVRAWAGEDALSMRDATDGGAGDTLFGHFAVYNRWTEINSSIEGHFLERVAPDAFVASFERRTPKVLFNHGKDPSVGNKPLGMPAILESRDGGAYYEVPLFDAGYVNDLKPAIRAGAFGASFRFGVPDGGDEWNDHPTRNADNPNGLPERTLRSIDVYEFGPVTFPAYADASAGLRSMTDDFVERMLNDPVFLARLVERAGLKNIEPLLEAARGATGEEQEEREDNDSGGAADEVINLAERRMFLARLR